MEAFRPFAVSFYDAGEIYATYRRVRLLDRRNHLPAWPGPGEDGQVVIKRERHWKIPYIPVQFFHGLTGDRAFKKKQRRSKRLSTRPAGLEIRKFDFRKSS